MKIKKIFFSMISIISINSFSVVKNQSDSDRVLDNFNELQKKQNIENELKKLDNNTRIENNKTESAIENNENLESYVFNTISLIGEKKISSFQKNIMEKYKCNKKRYFKFSKGNVELLFEKRVYYDNCYDKYA